MNQQWTLIIAACLLTLLASCRGEKKERGPEDVVREVHQALRAGDMERAHRNVAYDFRLDEVLGDVWRVGSPDDRQGMVALVKGMFERTSRRLWQEHVGEGHLELMREGDAEEPVWISAQVKRGVEDKSAFRWRYRLHRLNGAWLITQREAVILGVPTDTAAFFRIATRRIAKKIGHEPDLAELVQALPQWQGRIRKRVMKIPDRGAPTARTRGGKPKGAEGQGAVP